MFKLINKRMKGEKGFTLIELLVVIIIIAILAAIAIPTFLGQRQKAQDASAKSLVRNAMTAIESAYVDLRTFLPATMTDTELQAIEPSIKFFSLPAAATVPTVLASANSVNYTGTANTYEVGSKSESGKTFGVAVSKLTGNTFYVGLVAKSW